MKRAICLALLATLATGSHAQSQSNAVDHAQPRPASTVKAQVTTITETYTSDGNTTTLRDSQSGEPVLQVLESSATSVLPPAQVFDQLDLSATLQRVQHHAQALQKAKNILNTGSDADALAQYASQAEALAQAAGQMMLVSQMQQLRASASDLQYAIAQQDGVKARALLMTIGRLL
ncbi:MAG: hypothetical protein Q4D61_07820 [Cardiobacteriaceae bacterium]|nr:hypothetical protein [Cardiobacteriaceae bacterium]